MKVLLAEGTGLLEKQPIISTLLKNGYFSYTVYIAEKQAQDPEYQNVILLSIVSDYSYNLRLKIQ